MKLIAEHFDGYTTGMLRWTLTAEHGIATVAARWIERTARRRRAFRFPFTDARIAEVADLIRGLKPLYDGMVDDLPVYSLYVSTDSEQLQIRVYESFEWSDELAAEIERFYRAWKPIDAEVEHAIAQAAQTELGQ